MTEPTHDELLAQLAAMQRQMKQLQKQLHAQQSGSGAIAQDNSAAAGAGGVAVRGDVHGNIYVGPPTSDPAAALAIYCRVFVAACRQLPLRSIDLGASDPTGNRKQLDLDQVYIDLDTTTRVPLTAAEKKPQKADAPDRAADRVLPLLEATIQQARLVILGAPGSGKSTFLNHLGLCLALHTLEPDQQWLDRLPQWPKPAANLIPISVTLRDFARRVPTAPTSAAPHQLWDFIGERLHAQNLAFVAEPLHARLEQGQVMVLLDGLDEIPTQHQRTFVRDAVLAFARRYPRIHLLVTCRTLSYQDPAWQLAELPAFTVAEFAPAKIQAFIRAWYGELVRLGAVKVDESPGLVQQLQVAVQRPDLRALAANPLLLTVMALVHAHKGRLPDARALLYEETIDLLLLRWEEIKAGAADETLSLRRLLAAVNRSEVDLKRVLWQLAFSAQGAAANADALADIGELQLEKALAALHPHKSRDWAAQIIELIKLRAGLLLERAPETYTFPHRTFQEYLAGAHLAAQANFAQQATRLVQDGALWRQVILLAAGRLVYSFGDLDKPLALVGELCPQAAPQTELAWRKVWLAGEVLEEIGLPRVQDSALGQDLQWHVRQRLADLVGTNVLTPVERAAAGRTLGRLGDPRPGVGVKAGLPDLAWSEPIPPGPFLMGGKENWAGGRSFTCDLIRQPYRISHYPITVAQYQTFIDAGGYEQAHYWTAAGWAWRIENQITGPDRYPEVFQTPNHPQVGVSWYEAVAFCAWLSAQLSRRIRLPSEPEWERAARHTDGRLYPWGDEGDLAQHCNMDDTGIGSTSAVGSFPAGHAVCGAADLAGNIWERCSTQWLNDYTNYEQKADHDLAGNARRVLRGGSFLSSRSDVRCAYRLRISRPFARNLDVGFRVVSPGL